MHAFLKGGKIERKEKTEEGGSKYQVILIISKFKN